jgi:CRP-like cAMP-binding protein
VFLWNKEVFEDLMREIPALASFSEKLFARSFNASQNRIYASISASAEQRYLDFMKAFPDLFNRIPQHMIASYLGITRETLSRIRNQYANR